MMIRSGMCSLIRVAFVCLSCVVVTPAFSQPKDTIPSIPALDSIASRIADTLTTETGQRADIRDVFIPDTVYLKNGDRLTGKILSFEQGRLKLDAQGPGIITIKWHKIVTISGGNSIYKVEDQAGSSFLGYIQPSADTGKIIVQGNLRYTLDLEDLVRIYPLEEEWYKGFKGNLGAGFSYTKSSDVLRLNAEYSVYYVVSKWRFINDFSYIETSTEDDAPSLRIESNLIALYSLPKNWLLAQFNSFNRNDELGIKSRLSFGAGGGNSPIVTERQRLLFLTGIVQNLEKDIESEQVVSNLEWPFTLQHTIYSFDAPNLSSSLSATSFVGLTEKKRFRFDAGIDVTWEFITDVKLQFSVYYNYDNKVLAGKTTKEDYGTVISLLIELK